MACEANNLHSTGGHWWRHAFVLNRWSLLSLYDAFWCCLGHTEASIHRNIYIYIIAFHSPAGKAKMCRAPALCWRAPFGGTVFLLNTVHQKSKYWNAKCFEYNLIVVAYYTTKKTQIWLDIQIGGFNVRYFRGLFRWILHYFPWNDGQSGNHRPTSFRGAIVSLKLLPKCRTSKVNGHST